MEGEGEGGVMYLLLFVALFAEVLASTCHFGAAHGVFFGCEMLFDLHLCYGVSMSLAEGGVGKTNHQVEREGVRFLPHRVELVVSL